MRNEIVRLYNVNGIKVFEGYIPKNEITKVCKKYNYSYIKTGSYIKGLTK